MLNIRHFSITVTSYLPSGWAIFLADHVPGIPKVLENNFKVKPNRHISTTPQKVKVNRTLYVMR